MKTKIFLSSLWYVFLPGSWYTKQQDQSKKAPAEGIFILGNWEQPKKFTKNSIDLDSSTRSSDLVGLRWNQCISVVAVVRVQSTMLVLQSTKFHWGIFMHSLFLLILFPGPTLNPYIPSSPPLSPCVSLPHLPQNLFSPSVISWPILTLTPTYMHIHTLKAKIHI